MGNAQSSSSVHSAPNNTFPPKPASSHSNQTNGTRALQRIGSNATLRRLYHQHNLSSATMPNKALAWKNQHGGGERILDIGKPTKFEHGIHVEYDDDSGKFMGLPDVWQGDFPSDDILDTTFIHPILVPTSEASDASIGQPYNIKHHVHVELDEDGVGYKGLPKGWQELLSKSSYHPKQRHPMRTIKTIESCDIPLRADSWDQADTKSDKKLIVGLDERMSLMLPDIEAKESSFSAEVLEAVQEIQQERAAEPISPLPSSSLPPSPPIVSSPIPPAPPPSALINSTLPPIPVFPKPPSSIPVLDDVADNPTTNPSSLYYEYELIAEGESGPLYAAKHIATDRAVVIKKVSKTAVNKITKIRNELITMKMSRHPNVVEFITSYVTQNEIWVVMEYMDMALSDILALESAEQEPCIQIREELIARITRDILRALTRIHRLNRIHRDIRSDNILLNLRGDVKLSDFSQCAQLSPSKPKRNSIVGTPYWMAPEVITGQEYDTKVDIWSLGVSIYEIAHNSPPYIEHPPLKALYLIAANGLPALQKPEQWSDDFKDFLEQCTSIHPNQRPDANTLLKHPFITNSVGTTEDMISLITRAREIETIQQLEQDEDVIEKDFTA